MTASNAITKLFIWHHPADIKAAAQISSLLEPWGFEIIYYDDHRFVGGISFSAVEWQLSTIDCVLFILSKNTADSTDLVSDIKKVIRKREIKIIPTIIDDQALDHIPYLLYFIPFLDLRNEINEVTQFSTNTDNVDKLLFWIAQDSKSYGLNKPIQWMIDHFRRYFTLRPLTFCWQITIENLIVSLAVTGLILLVFQPTSRTNLEALSAGRFLWLIIVMGPIVETFFLQAIPVFFARVLKFKFFGQIFFSVLPFAILHFSRSVGSGIGAGIIGGFYSAFTYVHWRQKSLWTAFWITALSHGLYNLAIFAMIIGDY